MLQTLFERRKELNISADDVNKAHKASSELIDSKKKSVVVDVAKPAATDAPKMNRDKGEGTALDPKSGPSSATTSSRFVSFV